MGGVGGRGISFLFFRRVIFHQMPTRERYVILKTTVDSLLKDISSELSSRRNSHH